ncbi:hypothetical protein BofuT4_uP112700.1 [Botrytis cinerea T4]|uniref:Uncharacterized protein n=1 Tax=Botryotinia fuckeliana (strain T4) TaxID=999810 RepID=G2Y5M0_BOTF4|nr:hypothetical protein BofuT4_uP112700.1 [Botrytis cinerea T4]
MRVNKHLTSADELIGYKIFMIEVLVVFYIPSKPFQRAETRIVRQSKSTLNPTFCVSFSARKSAIELHKSHE